MSLLMPKRVKYRKPQRGAMRATASAGNKLSFGDYGIQAIDRGWVTARQIEAARRAVTRFVKRGGKIWVRIFPDKAITARPPETRMGKGKGAPEFWVFVAKPGHILFEIGGVTEADAQEAMRLAAHKLSVKTRFLKAADYRSL
jgi:large subunit ribosomal protein L16